MWKKLLVFVIAVALLIGLGIGLYFIFNKTPARLNIAADENYYFHRMWNGFYTEDAIEERIVNPFAGGFINLDGIHDSYCVFNEGFKTFEIHFIGEASLRFIIVKYRRTNRNGFTATVEHIYNGDIIRYQVSTTKDEIVIKSTVSQRIKTATIDEFGEAYRTIERNTQVMTFKQRMP